MQEKKAPRRTGLPAMFCSPHVLHKAKWRWNYLGKHRSGRNKILQQPLIAILWDHCEALQFPGGYSQTDIRDKNICLVRMKRREWEVLHHNLWDCLLIQWWWPVVKVFHPVWHWEWPHPGCSQWRSTVGYNWLYREQNCGTSSVVGSLSHYFVSWSQASG